MTVNIYIYHTIRGPGKKKGAYAYVLETEIDKKIVTVEDVNLLEPITEHKAELEILLKTLKRLRKTCDVLVIGANDYIRQGFETWLDNWKATNWLNAKGKEVANKELWQQVDTFRDTYNIKICEPSQHEYMYWMKNETERILKNEG